MLLTRLTSTLRQTTTLEFYNIEYYLRLFTRPIIRSQLNKEVLNLRHILNKNKNELGYSRHLLTKNDILSAYIIQWDEGSQSNIHGHPKNGCYMYFLSGIFKEEIYNDDTLVKTIMNPNGIRFIRDEIGQHRISNIGNEIGYTINIYSPNCSTNLDTESLDLFYKMNNL